MKFKNLLLLSFLFLGRCVLPEAASAADLMSGNNSIEHCRKFAAVAGGVASMSAHEKAVATTTAQSFGTNKREALSKAISFVDHYRIRSPTQAQNEALARCYGHREPSPSLWEWNLGIGFIGHY